MSPENEPTNVEGVEGATSPGRSDPIVVESVGVLSEVVPGERRVAITPAVVPVLAKAGLNALTRSVAMEYTLAGERAVRE